MKLFLFVAALLLTTTINAQIRDTCTDRYDRQVVHIVWADSTHVEVQGAYRWWSRYDHRIVRLTKSGRAYHRLTFAHKRKKRVITPE